MLDRYSRSLIKLEENGKPVNIRSIDSFDSLRARAGKSSTATKRVKPDDELSPKEKEPKQRRQKQTECETGTFSL